LAELGADGGWTASASGWLDLIDGGEPNRELLLDPVMLDLCGDVTGLRVLDLGCGEGRFCRLLSQRGARSFGADPIAELIGAAQARQPAGAYTRGSGDRLPFAAASFDLVVSYLSLIDIPDFRAAISEAVRVLRGGGRLLVANLGFVTASEGWLRDEAGHRLHHRVDRYAEERPIFIEIPAANLRIQNWHRPLSDYMAAYLSAGLMLRAFLEPVPPDDTLRKDPRFEDWYRVPLFTVMLWEKPA
jgi:SAM-dependent methyltransferase